MTTTLGVRPLGVRGEPLHQTQAQIRAAIRRRLGDRHAALLTDAQPHTEGPGLDWYAEVEGPLRPVSSLSQLHRREVVDEIDRMLATIAALGRELAVAGAGDAALTGRSLQQAVRRPSDDYLFLVGDQPVIVAWGYEAESLPQPLKLTLPVPPPAPPPPPVLAAPPAILASTAPALAAAPASLLSRFLYWLLLGILLVFLLLGLSWLLRTCASGEPDIAIERLPPEPVAAAPEPPPDPTPEKRATLASLTDQDKLLRADLAKLELELRDKRAQCRPPEPPRVAVAPPPPPPPPPPPRPQPPAVRQPEPPPPPPPPPPRQAVAPPPAAPPPGSIPCNVDTASGGQGVTRNKHFLGNQPGPVTINYDMKTIPDQMNVYYQGQLVASTNRMLSGRGGISFNWQPRGTDYTVMVEVVGPNPGTSWRYIVRCP